MPALQFKTLVRLAGIDRDVGFALASRAVMAGGQLITLGLISFLMSPAVQGYHFTFLSIISIQTFLELGFYIVIVNTCAHEWAHLQMDGKGAVCGSIRSHQRLAALLRFATRWYALVSSLFIILALVAGWLFFSGQPDIGVSWKMPWTMLVLGAGLQIWANAILSFLEGCSQIAEAYRIRVIALGIGQVAGWTVLAMRGELWTAPIMEGTTAALQLLLAWRSRGPLFRSLFNSWSGQTISWRSELWPLQWRLGLQVLSSFFFFSLFTPVAFHYHGATVAGRIGLSWTIANGLYSMFSSWFQARAPRLALLVAQGEHHQLARLFRQTVAISTLALFLSLALVWSVLALLYLTGSPLSQRFLHPALLGCFFAAALLLHLSGSLSTYFRAHKQDPSTALNLLTGISIGIVIWAAGALSGPAAMVIGFLLVLALFLVPCQTAIFLRYRQRWHAPSPTTQYDHAT